MREAQQSYQANLNVIDAAKAMLEPHHRPAARLSEPDQGNDEWPINFIERGRTPMPMPAA